MKFGLFSTDPELEKLQRGFVAEAVVSQTQYILACVKRVVFVGQFRENQIRQKRTVFCIM